MKNQTESRKTSNRKYKGCNTTKPGNQSKRMYDKVVCKYKINSYIVR